MKKRILSILICLVLTLSLLPTTALAAEGTSIGTESFTQVGNYYYKATEANVVTVEEDTVTIAGTDKSVIISSSSDSSSSYTWTSKADSTTFAVDGISDIRLTAGAVSYTDGPTVTHGNGSVGVSSNRVSLDAGEKATVDEVTYEVSSGSSGSCYIYHAASGTYESGDVSLYNTSLTVSANDNSATYTAVGTDTATFSVGDTPGTITIKSGSIQTGSGATKATYTPANDADITIKDCGTETPYFAYNGQGSITVPTDGAKVYFALSDGATILSAATTDASATVAVGGKVTVAQGSGTVTLSTTGENPQSTTINASSDGSVTVTPAVSSDGKLSTSLTSGTVTITDGQSATFVKTVNSTNYSLTYTAGTGSSVTVNRAGNLADYDTVTVTSGSVTVSAEGYTAFSSPAIYEKSGDEALVFDVHYYVSEGVEVTDGTAKIGQGTYYLYNKKYVTVVENNTATVTSAGVTGSVTISNDSAGSNKIMTVSDGLTVDTTQDPIAVSGQNGTVTLSSGKSVVIAGRTYTSKGDDNNTITLANGAITTGSNIEVGPYIIIYDASDTVKTTRTINGVTYTALEVVTPANIELLPNDDNTVTVTLPNSNPIQITKGSVTHQFSIAAGDGDTATLTVDTDCNVTLTTDTNGYLSVFPGSTIKAGDHTFTNTGTEVNGYTGVFTVNASGDLRFVRNAYCAMEDGTTVNCTNFSSGGDGAVITADNDGTLTLDGFYGIEVGGLKFTTLDAGETDTAKVSGIFNGTPYLTVGGVRVEDADANDDITELKLYFLKEGATDEYDSISSTSSFGYSLTTGLAATEGVTVADGVTILVNGNDVTGPCTVSKETYSESTPENLTGEATVTATGTAKIGDGITLTNGSVATIAYSTTTEDPGDVTLTSGSATVAAGSGNEPYVIFVNDVPVSGPATVNLSDGTATVTATGDNATVNSAITLDNGAKVTFTGNEDVTLTNGSVTLGAAGGKINVGNYTVDGSNTKITAANGSYTIVDPNTQGAMSTAIKSGENTLLTIQNDEVTIKDGKITLDKGTVALEANQTIYIDGTIKVDGAGDVTVTDGKAELGVKETATASGAYGQKRSELTVNAPTVYIGTTSTAVTGTWALNGDADTVLGAGTTSDTATFTPGTNSDKFAELTIDITVTVDPATPTITVTPNHHTQTHGKDVTVTVTAANPHNADLPDVPTQFTLTYQIGNDTTMYTITGDTFTIPADTAAGTEITITATSAAVTGKYEASSGTAKVTVTDKQVPTLTAAAFTKVYDGNPVTIGDITKSAKDDDGKDIPGTWSFDNGEGPKNVADSGSWTLKFTPTDTATYASETVDVQVTITKATITATVTMANWTVGETASEPSVTSTPSTDSYTVHYKVKGADDSTYTTTKPTEAGDYTVRVTVAGSDNYEGATATADFSILATEPDDGGYTPPSTTPSTPSTPSVVSVTVPISGDDNTIHVKASVSGDKATIDEVDLTKLDTVIGDDVDTGVVTIDFSGLKTSKPITTVEIPADVVKQIAQAVSDPTNDAESLEIVFSDGTSIEFDAEALGEKSAQADGLDVTISIKHAEDAKPTAAQEEAIGDRPAFDITVTSGGKPISDMGGKVTVHAPYELREGEDPRGIVVWYVDENGNQEACETSYDSVKKRVNWKTDHLSLYVIGYDEELAKSCPKDETCPMYPYTDVDVNAWYHDAVHYCMENGLMGSTSTTESLFAPDATASRAMIATILHRMEGTPQPTTTGTFTDVADGLWYTEAVEWAAANGIVLGYNGKFDPDDPITREQFAVMLWRYAGSPASTTTELNFTDADEVSDWAMEALIWAQENGIMQGYNNAVDPQGNATRSCVAQMFKNFLENVLK